MSEKKGRRLKVAAATSLQEASRVDWNICCICQVDDKTHDLQCPARNPIVSRQRAGYQGVAARFDELRELNYVLPSRMPVERLDDGEGFTATLSAHRAKWHNSCVKVFRDGEKFKRLLSEVKSKKNTALLPLKESAGEPENVPPTPSGRETRSTAPLVRVKDDVCFLCGKGGNDQNPLNQCMTKEVFDKIKKSAEIVNDTNILGILSGGDLIAQEAKYHLTCLVRLYNRKRRVEGASAESSEDGVIMCEGIAFSDLLVYIQGKLNENRILKMGALREMYVSRIADLLDIPAQDVPYVHTSRLREKIIAHFPTVRAEKEGKEYVLRHPTSSLLCNVEHEDQDEDAIAFQRFMKRLRNEISKYQVSFSGSFVKDSRGQCPPALLAAMNLLLYGKSVVTKCGATEPAVSLCQLIMLNFEGKAPQGDIVRHKKTREPLLPLYIGLSTYGRTRSRTAIDEMHSYGLSVSSSRIIEETSNLSLLVVKRANDENILCPSNLKTGVFTICAVDNIDHNPSSTTSVGSFHGTSLSVFQIPSEEYPGVAREFASSYSDVSGKGRRSVPPLPEFYGVVPDYTLSSKTPPMPLSSSSMIVQMTEKAPMRSDLSHADPWLTHIRGQMAEPMAEKAQLDLSWSAYYASSEQPNTLLPAINSLLPLFHESSKSPAMIRHAMTLIIELTKYLNNGQIPVMYADQPLYTLMKLIQWNEPNVFGETKFLAMFGQLHIEKDFLGIIGDFAEKSGWTTIMANSGIISTGSAESVLKVTHITRARGFYQVTAAALYSLLHDAYEISVPDKDVNIEEWISESSKKPTFLYWLLFLKLIITLLSFVRAVRQGNWILYKEALHRMMPWFFLFDRFNYARWLTVHVRDIEELAEKCPALHEQFLRGKFVVHKTNRAFSGLGGDHAHEQNNKRVKSHGGAVGLTQDPIALRRWMLAGPEIDRLLREYHGEENEDDDNTHHEQTVAFQKRFLENCNNLKESFIQSGNPFFEMSDELVNIDSGATVDSIGVEALQRAEARGSELYRKFVDERLVRKTKSMNDTLSKVSFQVFSRKSVKSQDRQKMRSKLDLVLYQRLFIVSIARNLNLDKFFEYENQAEPPTIALHGNLRQGDKACLVSILEGLLTEKYEAPKSFDGVIYDGAAVVHFMAPKASKTFGTYAHQEFIPFLEKQVSNLSSQRADVVWDLYNTKSIKQDTRDARGVGARKKITGIGALPKSWNDYLKNADNKTELFSFLAKMLLARKGSVTFVSNDGGVIGSSGPINTGLNGKKCSAMEEADIRIMVHLYDMVTNGAQKVLIRTVDTDVVVLSVSHFYKLLDKGLRELWVLFGTGNSRRYIPIHLIALALGPAWALALIAFHAFTGCDTTSYFLFRGKKIAWNTWKSFPEATNAFVALSTPLQSIPQDVFETLQRFTVLMYDKKSTVKGVNEARKDLFTTGDRTIYNIPPTEAALLQHALRAAYQAGHLWGTITNITQPPSPTLWGWTETPTGYTPLWTKSEQLWETCSELARCGCQGGEDACKTNRCSCRRNNVACTPHCKKCRGKCTNERQMNPIEEEDYL